MRKLSRPFVTPWPALMLGAGLLLGCAGPGAPIAPTPVASSPAPSASPPATGPVAIDGLTTFEVGAGARRPLLGTPGTRYGGVVAMPGPGGTVSWQAAAAYQVSSRQPVSFGLLAERSVGSRETFWINDGSFTAAGDRQQSAVLRHISPHAFFYVDAGVRVSDTAVSALADAFESTIYARLTSAYGPEAKPGVDGEDRLFIVISPRLQTTDEELLGYFWARDAVPAGMGDDPHSNHKEVLFLSDRLLSASKVLAYGSLAHELQHLINFSRKGPALGYANKEATWLDEGLSMLAMDLAGYGLRQGEQLAARDVRAYLERPEAYSLTEWERNPNGYAFGMTYLFCRYLVDRYGEGVIRELVDSKLTGVEEVEAVLAAHGTHFEAFFREWAIANAVPGRPGVTGYAWFDPHGTYGGIALPGVKRLPAPLPDTQLMPWSTAYVRFTGPVTVQGSQRWLGAVWPESPQP